MLDRREFLGGTATWATASSLASAAVASSQKSRIKVGQIGTKHAHALGQLGTIRKFPDEFELVGVVEPDKQQRARLADRLRGVALLTEDQLLKTPGLQAVAVETEVKDLLSTAQRCAEAGLHLFVDKPPGSSMESLNKLLTVVDSKKLVLQMGYMLRYNPAFEWMFRAIKEGWLGRVFSIHAEMSKVVGADTRRALQKYPGGAMFELGCHLIDPIVMIMGKPLSVSPHVLKTKPALDQLADNMVTVLDYDRANVVIRSGLNEVGGFQRRQFVVMGDKGTLEIRPLESNRITLELAESRGDYKRGRHTIELKGRGRYDGLWQSFAQAIRGEQSLPWNSRHNLAAQEVLLRSCDLPL